MSRWGCFSVNLELELELELELIQTQMAQKPMLWAEVYAHVSVSRWGCFSVNLELELELELIHTQMAQKPVLRAEVYAHAMRLSLNCKKGSAYLLVHKQHKYILFLSPPRGGTFFF